MKDYYEGLIVNRRDYGGYIVNLNIVIRRLCPWRECALCCVCVCHILTCNVGFEKSNVDSRKCPNQKVRVGARRKRVEDNAKSKRYLSLINYSDSRLRVN